jgi:hypothetical protein
MKLVSDYAYAPRFRYGWSGTREQFIEGIDEVLSRIPEEQRSSALIELETEDEYGSTYIVVKVAFSRPQTKEEAKTEEEGKARSLRWKRAQLERLKKELGE